MNTRFTHVWELLTSSYWFVPAVMLIGSLGLAVGMLFVDRHFVEPLGTLPWLYAGGTEGARALLATVASSVITVAGVVFSITIATLTQASSQFGPRLLRNFMRDTGNQVVLGTFVATFTYSLLVLRAIKDADDEAFVPQASVTGATLLALASLCVLIYFIHHVSQGLQAPHVVAAVVHEFDEALRHMYPEGFGHGGRPVEREADAKRLANPLPQPGVPDDDGGDALTSEHSGYLQAIDPHAIMSLATRRDVVFTLLCRPGDYIIEGNPLARVLPAGCADDSLEHDFRAAFIFGNARTAEQDVEFTLSQMVEIAVRALSPGINDPFTAINCIDWLGRCLVLLAERDLHSPYRHDDRGRLRVVARLTTFEGYVATAFNPIRQYGRGSAQVTIRLLETLALIVPRAKDDEQRRNLLAQAELVLLHSRDGLAEHDHRDARSRFDAVVAAVDAARARVRSER